MILIKTDLGDIINYRTHWRETLMIFKTLGKEFGHSIMALLNTSGIFRSFSSSSRKPRSMPLLIPSIIWWCKICQQILITIRGIALYVTLCACSKSELGGGNVRKPQKYTSSQQEGSWKLSEMFYARRSLVKRYDTFYKRYRKMSKIVQRSE